MLSESKLTGESPATPAANSATDMRKLSTARPWIDSLIETWKSEVDTKVSENRLVRKAIVNVKALRNKGELRPHETYVAVRQIDTNIAQKLPPHLAYLAQSRRLAIFEPEIGAAKYSTDTEYLEMEMTRVLRYPKWELDYVRALDASKLHGIGWTRVKFDTKYPGHVQVKHVKVEHLAFDKRVSDIQESKIVVQFHPVTAVTFEEFVRANTGFDTVVVEEIRKTLANSQSVNPQTAETLIIYEIFFKQDGGVYEGWYWKSQGDRWLKTPSPYFNGVKRRQQKIGPAANGIALSTQITEEWVEDGEKQFPYQCLRYRVTESDILVDEDGQAQLDYYKQDAASSLWSTFINGCWSASRTMWAPTNANPDEGGQAPKQLSCTIEDGKIWATPMTPFNAPYPDSMLLRGLDYLNTQNSMENSNIAFAVNNRKDSRKTATENNMAAQQQALVTGVDVLMFSVFLREVFTACWRIIQSEALQNNIIFCADQSGQNDVKLLGATYQVKAAGDNDFIEKQTLIQNMQQDWPVISATPAKDAFVKLFIQTRYPNNCKELLAAIDSAAQSDKQLIQGLAVLVKELSTDEHGQLKPDVQQYIQPAQLAQLEQRVQQSLGATPNAQSNGSTPQQPAGGGSQPAIPQQSRINSNLNNQV